MAEDQHDTEELHSEQAAREAAEKRLEDDAATPDEADQHARRAEKSAYLKEKLAERAESEREGADRDE
jgi:hypothetical protein